MNYFELYGMPVSFQADESEIKKKYFELSKKFHPDFYASQSAEKQQEMLEMSTLNTRAFQNLSDFDRRMKYILEQKKLIFEGERYVLSPDFLMEMMEINEELEELKIENEEAKTKKSGLKISDLLYRLQDEMKKILDNYNDATTTESDLNKIKDYYYKKKYLLRLKESWDNFGNSEMSPES